jgi:RNA polymerase sigma-70 factor (ECF subfamily)
MAVGHKRALRPLRGPGAMTIDRLLARVARGDASAFASVCDQVSGAVCGLVRRIVWDQSRADQVAAEALVEVWRSASRFSPAEGSGLSWVMTIARRRALRQAGAAADSRAAMLAGAWVAPERAAASLVAHRGLASLPGPQREAVLLACCGCTWLEMADLTGTTAATVAERLRDGLRGLSGRPEMEDR